MDFPYSTWASLQTPSPMHHMALTALAAQLNPAHLSRCCESGAANIWLFQMLCHCHTMWCKGKIVTGLTSQESQPCSWAAPAGAAIPPRNIQIFSLSKLCRRMQFPLLLNMLMKQFRIYGHNKQDGTSGQFCTETRQVKCLWGKITSQNHLIGLPNLATR